MLAVTACLIAAACESAGGGGDCFPPDHGPTGPSCAGFDVGLSCPVGGVAWYTCVCSPGASGKSSDQTWVCNPAGSMSAGGAGGAGGSGGAGTGGSGTGGSGGSAASGG